MRIGQTLRVTAESYRGAPRGPINFGLASGCIGAIFRASDRLTISHSYVRLGGSRIGGAVSCAESKGFRKRSAKISSSRFQKGFGGNMGKIIGIDLGTTNS